MGGDIPPIKLQNSGFFNGHFSEVLQESVFFNGHLVKSFKKVFRRQIRFFSKFVSPPINFFLAETLDRARSRKYRLQQIMIRAQGNRWK